MAGRLAGRRAIVTGAGSGIGRASAIRFAEEGAAVFAVDVDAAGLAETAAAAPAGGQLHIEQGDVADEAFVASVVAACAQRFGGLEVFFANAGVSGEAKSVLDLTVEDWERVLRVNLIGPFLAIKYGARFMRDHGGGSILCTASVAGLRSGAGPSPYSASKAGVVNLVKTAAYQLAGTNVRVNAVCPGLIETGMTQPLFDAARAAGKGDRIGQLNPLQRSGEPREIAATALFLASDESSYVNGQAIAVDGGLSSSHPYAGRHLF